MPKSGAVKLIDNFASVMRGVELLTGTNVMVGVPGDKAGRREGGPINNAELAYIHDKGAPEANIPARPFMEPGIASVREQLIKEMQNAGNAALKGGTSVVTYLNRVGIIATRAIKAKISEGIPPPLAPSTIAGRIRRIKGKKRRQKITDARAVGTPWSRQLGTEGIFTPLIVTGALRNSITYVLRDVLRSKFVKQRDIRKT
jgi:hypothetical protein